ncbi:hypothetical protein [Verrucomicrobium sp. BvORR034]|uniref:hypothetical protein n=1 Tax=Verrucomicrobium sp. BvORR034 TaxID=1396418 RepID=UPI002240EAE8|nr:hypothetical protein [Verrucomicrobium sp. BvORR034]
MPSCRHDPNAHRDSFHLPCLRDAPDCANGAGRRLWALSWLWVNDYLTEAGARCTGSWPGVGAESSSRGTYEPSSCDLAWNRSFGASLGAAGCLTPWGRRGWTSGPASRSSTSTEGVGPAPHDRHQGRSCLAQPARQSPSIEWPLASRLTAAPVAKCPVAPGFTPPYRPANETSGSCSRRSR